MSRFNIKMTDEAKAAAARYAEEDKALRFSVERSGCCSMSVSIYPDFERDRDEVMEVEGIRILTRNEYPELGWVGTIDYKSKGLRKGFTWK